MLWVDKHRPKDLDHMDVHKELSGRLKNVVSNGDFPHLLFFGPSGAGKKTRVMALLRHYFGPGVERLKSEHKTYKATESKTIEISTLTSQYHIEVNPSEAGIYDRIVIMTMIKEIAESAPLDSNSGKKGFKVIILNEVDNLSRGAQQVLRRTMEKYVQNCRLILLATSTSKVIDPLCSRCLSIRVPAPAEDEIISVLQHVSKKEGLTLPASFASNIARHSSRNLRRALLMLEASKVQQYPFVPNQEVTTTDWENYVITVAKDILSEQSPKKVLEVRGKFYELLANCIPAEVIFRRLADALIEYITIDSLKADIVHWAAHYEHSARLGSKAIFHLEAFVCKFMFIYRTALNTRM